ncbi:caldesmon-like [Helianthus annuus]|uniref:caldesmon-like n=1 Tax=Helianthus annuus TaxID=4232 RepID=UPI001653243D|nr:caldesmon-like [Helianthus annuus]
MAEEFYNAFATPVALVTAAETVYSENEMGTNQKPPKLMYIEDFQGNNQTGDGFWSKVLAKFLDLMDQGPYRDIDSVSSKWRKLNASVNRFCQEYNKISTSGRRSSMSDDDVFKQALDKYKANNEEYAVHEAESPPGRDKSKKERAKGKEKEKVDPKMEEFMENLKMYNEVSAQKTKAKEQAVEEKARVAEEKLREKVRLSNEKIRISDEKIRLKEWEMITMDVDQYPEPKRLMLKKLQTDIMKKHNII